MAISYGLAGVRNQAASGTSVSAGLPTGITAGMLLIAVAGSKNNATHTWDAAWTKKDQVNSTTGWTVSWAIRIATGDVNDTAPTVTWTGSVANFCRVTRWTSTATFSLTDVIGAMGTAGVGSTSTHTSPSITSTRNASMAVYIDACAVNTTLTQPGTYTQNVATGSNTGASADAFGSKTLATAGTASGAISTTGGAAAWTQFIFEIRDYTPTRVTNDYSDSFAVQARTTNDFADAFTVKARVTSDYADSFTLRTRITSSFSDSFTLSSRVTQTFSDAYAVSQRLQISFADTYTVTGRITKDFTDSFTVSGRITKDYTDSFVVGYKVSQNFSDSYAVSQRVQSSYADAYSVLVRVAQDFADSYTLRTRVGQALSDAYTVFARVWSDFTDPFDISLADEFARPMEDVATGLWQPSLNGSPLYAMVDETAPDSSDYIFVEEPSSTAELKLCPTLPVVPNAGHSVQLVAHGTPGRTLQVKLMQGATEIGSWDQMVTATPTAYDLPLSAAQIASISNYNDLRFKLVGV